MKRLYIASICENGILGGCIAAGDESMTFKTGKVTVSPKLRNLEMKYGDIQSFSRKWVLCFPVYSISMNNGDCYKFILFGPGSFRSLLCEKVKQ